MPTSKKQYLLLFFLLLSGNHISKTFFDNDDFIKYLLKGGDAVAQFFNEEITKHREETEAQIRELERQKQNLQQQRTNNSQKSRQNLFNKYITDLQNDLNGLPQDEIEEIIKVTQQELQYVDLNNANLVQNKIRSVLIAHVEHYISLDISAYEVQNNKNVNNDDRRTIQENRLNAFINKINESTSISGNYIKTFFGDYRKSAINAACDKAVAVQQKKQQSYPVPSNPPTHGPQYTPSLPQSHTTQIHHNNHAKELENLLKKGKNNNSTDSLSSQDKHDLMRGLSANCSDNEFDNNVRASIRELLEKKLEKEKEALYSERKYSETEIENAIKSAREKKNTEINRLKKINNNTEINTEIAKIIGDDRHRESNIRNTIYENLATCRR